MTDPRAVAPRRARKRAALLAAVVGASALGTQAAAAPLSCPVRQLEELGAARGLAAVIALADGDGAVAWSPTDASTGAVSARRLRDGAPVGRERVLAGLGRAQGMRALATPAGETVVVFQRIRGEGPQSVMAAALAPDGFTPPTRLSTIHASLPDASLAPDGTVRAAWIESVPLVGYRVVTATRSPGGDWSTPATVASAPAPIDEIRVLAGPAGSAVIAWRSGLRGVRALMVRRDVGLSL